LNKEIEELKFDLGIYQNKRWFYTYSRCLLEYIYDVKLNRYLLVELKQRGVDLFVFVQRSFLDSPSGGLQFLFYKDFEDLAILKITSYDDWWTKAIRKKERYSVKKALKSGVEVRRVEVNETFLRGLQAIYDETPIREGRRFNLYGLNLPALRARFHHIDEVLGAYFDGKLIGTLGMAYGERAAMFRGFSSSLLHRDKCPNNALIDEAVRRCAERRIPFLVYGNHYGFLPSLDSFRESQGFRRFSIARYYVPLTRAGQLAIAFGLHKSAYYAMPFIMERALLPVYNYFSRIVPSQIWSRTGVE
jgi:hypothetical protein